MTERRTPLRSKALTSGSKRVSHSTTSNPRPDDAFKTTKEDKRRIKHSSLISRIEKASSRAKKRRRPSKMLIANLESLVDALPEIALNTEDANTGSARILHRSLKSKPGALKKKERLEKMEMDRFSRNMAQMASTIGYKSRSPSSAQAMQLQVAHNGRSERWTALRGFIQSTLDRDVNEAT